jgi:hypothetical protein
MSDLLDGLVGREDVVVFQELEQFGGILDKFLEVGVTHDRERDLGIFFERGFNLPNSQDLYIGANSPITLPLWSLRGRLVISS